MNNQTTFREANGRLHDLAQVDGGTLVPFLCECADIECLGRVEASLSEFEVVHEDHPQQYFIMPGHPRIEGEKIVGANARYEVVSKG